MSLKCLWYHLFIWIYVNITALDGISRTPSPTNSPTNDTISPTNNPTFVTIQPTIEPTYSPTWMNNCIASMPCIVTCGM